MACDKCATTNRLDDKLYKMVNDLMLRRRKQGQNEAYKIVISRVNLQKPLEQRTSGVRVNIPLHQRLGVHYLSTSK